MKDYAAGMAAMAAGPAAVAAEVLSPPRFQWADGVGRGALASGARALRQKHSSDDYIRYGFDGVMCAPVGN